MITEAKFGINGITLRRFIEGVVDQVMAYRNFANTILPGSGPSVSRLQPFSMLTPMPVVTAESVTDLVEPTFGYQILLSAIERGATLEITKTKFENAGADRDALVGGILFELGQLGPLTLDYLFDLWLSSYCFDGIATDLGVSGGNALPFFSTANLRYKGDTDPNNNHLGTQNFGPHGFGEALIKLNSQKTTTGKVIRASKDLALVFGSALMVRVSEFLGSAGRPFEASNTYNIANDYTITPYMCPEYTSANSKEFFWSLFDRRAMVNPNGSGLNMKIMRYPGVYPSRSANGLVFYYSNTLRGGVGSGTKTFGVGAEGTA